MSSELRYKITSVHPNEDILHEAKNILDEAAYTMWTTAGVEKKAWVDIVFTRDAQIHSIEVVNNGAAFIEVAVSKSVPFANGHPLLPPQSLRSLNEVRQKKNMNVRREFSATQMHRLNVQQKWTSMRVTVSQPFPEAIPIGLCCLLLRDIGCETEIATPKPPEKNVKQLLASPETPIPLPESVSGSDTEEEDNEDPLAALRRNETLRIQSYAHPKPQAQPQAAKHSMPAVIQPPVKKAKLAVKPATKPASVASAPVPKAKVPQQPPKSKPSKSPVVKSSMPVKVASPPASNKVKSPPQAPLPAAPQVTSSSTFPVSAPSPLTSGPPLAGVTIVLSGFQNPLRSDLRNMALSLGAKYAADWVQGGTHLVCAYYGTPKHNEVMQAGKGYVVTKDWLEDCKKQGRRLAEKDYKLEPPPSDSDSDDGGLVSSSSSSGGSTYDSDSGTSSSSSVDLMELDLDSGSASHSLSTPSKKKKAKAKKAPKPKKAAKKAAKPPAKPQAKPAPPPLPVASPPKSLISSDTETEIIPVPAIPPAPVAPKAVGVHATPVAAPPCFVAQDNDSDATEGFDDVEIQQAKHDLHQALHPRQPQGKSIVGQSSSSGQDITMYVSEPPSDLPVLPDFLKGTIVWISPSLSSNMLNSLKKKVLLSGGRICSKGQNPTHCIVASSQDQHPGGAKVTPVWVTDCQLKCRLLPPSKYAPS